MANRIQVLYLAVGGKYRRRTIRQNHPEPTTLRNVPDQQLHLLRGAPIFNKIMRPAALETFDQLVKADPPPPLELPERQMMICEDNNPFPVSQIAAMPPAEEQLRHMEDVYQEYYQAAEADVSKSNSGSNTDKVMIVTAVVAIGLMGVIGMIVATKVFGETDAVTAIFHFHNVWLSWRT